MDIVCTLYEKHYDYGVGALCNSLIKSGFNGKIIVGYKGKLPFWVNQLSKINNKDFKINSGTIITFLNLNDISYHLGYYKANIILYCVENYRNLSSISYFDPDICIKAPWSFFQKWNECGIALATDNCYPFLHSNHPWRKSWVNLFPDLEVVSRPEFYVNSGFISINKYNFEIILLWQKAIDKYISLGGSIQSFERDATQDLKGDQDLLNAALMFIENEKLSIIGREAMGFEPPNYIMGHAISGEKPWKKKFTKSYLKNGEKPSFSEKLFFMNAIYPIKLFNKINFRTKKIDLSLASLLNRIL